MKWRVVYKQINRLAAENILEQQEYHTFEEVLSTLSQSLDATWTVMDQQKLGFVFKNDIMKAVVAYRNNDMITLEKVFPQQNQVPNTAPRLL